MTEIYVYSGATGDGTGDGPSNAFLTVAAAIAIATNDGEIRICNGHDERAAATINQRPDCDMST